MQHRVEVNFTLCHFAIDETTFFNLNPKRSIQG